MSLLSAQLDPVHWDRSYDKLFAKWQPKSVRIINPDKERVRKVLAVSPNSLILLRDHPLSEQHDNLKRAPVQTAIEHARRWNELVNKYEVPHREQMVVLGINEPLVHTPGIDKAVDAYSLQFMKECDTYNLRAGIYSFSTGWPADTGQGPGSPVDWSPYTRSLDYLEAHPHHYALLHEYWCQAGPQVTADLKPSTTGGPWGWNPGRHRQLTRNVNIIIGECGLEELVCNPKVTMAQRGWKNYIKPEVYLRQLLEYEKALAQDKRIHSAQIFILDGNSEWQSLWYHEIVPLLGSNSDFAWRIPKTPVIEKPPPVEVPQQESALHRALRVVGRNAQLITLNRDAALQKRIAEDKLVPVANEFIATYSEQHYVVQRAEDLSTGAGYTYFVVVNDWDKVMRISD